MFTASGLPGTTVNAMALQVLEQAQTQSVDPYDMEEFALAHATEAGATNWQTEALATLCNVWDAIMPDNEVRYVNGQHRSQAMLDAGVRRTVVLHHIEP
ncbi:hypothetical protein ACFVZW_06325 [Streptomyces sp. NPDC059567]|uniref:hypothetical protein n=1 Tax=Streptomyces sp. NPDC059567 TaxID=3346867 RepID=UPI0036747EDA